VKKLGVDYQTLKGFNPRLIYASISGFGQTGPWADRPGFDLMAQAMSGVMSVNGHPGMPPSKAGVPVADLGCALFCTYAILSAYIGRQKSGEGQYIDASLFEAALAFSIWDTSEYWGTGEVPTPVGTSNKMSAPYQAVKSKDGYFVIGATNEKLWNQLCNQIGRPGLLNDVRFNGNAARLKHREALIDALEETFVTRSSDEWVDELLAAGIPAGKMSTYPEAFESEHAKHRNMRVEIPHPIEGTIPNIGFPVKLTGTPQQIRLHPPLLGEHTESVLSEIGFATSEITGLKARGAFGP
jgi:crotonobetainyl-CoA:carnitine CoA-transferase CaiB-like acyl-CoA transferase